jgi:rhodanese-related sulfurtransferase
MQDIVKFAQLHWILSLALVVVLILLVILEFIKIRRSAASVSSQQAVQLMNHQNAVVVDIRSPEAFVNGHIVGSISLPMRDITEDKIKKIDKLRTQPIIIACTRGQESTRAADILGKKGFNIRVLEGGIFAWQQAGLPLVKD